MSTVYKMIEDIRIIKDAGPVLIFLRPGAK